MPGLEVARTYQRSWLRNDATAGAILTVLLIPAGIGYAQAAGLPPETGLYATIVPLLAYAIFGPSRVLALAADDPARAVALAGLLALMMGAVLLVGGLVRAGFVTDLLSKPIRVGYLNGIALIVLVGQVPKLLGFSIDATSLVGEIRAIVHGLANDAVNTRSVVLGVGALLLIMTPRLLGSKLPGILVAVVGSSVLVAVLGWKDELPVVGALPVGLPSPQLAGLRWSDVRSLAGPALGIALIAFADTGVLSRTFAARRGETVDGSREMAAIGVANMASGLFGGFPVSASSSRTPVAEQAGARTQLVGVVGAVLIVAFILIAPGLTGYLPSSVLAAVVISAAITLIDIHNFRWLVRTDLVDALLGLAAFLGVVLIGVLEGIAITIGLSFLAFVIRSWRPYRAELGRVAGVRGYHDLARHPEGERVPGIVIARFDAPLFFANGGLFDDFVRSLVANAPPDVHTVILASEPITDIDTTAVDELLELDAYLSSKGIRLVFAEMKDPVRDELIRYGLGERFSADRFMPTVGAAVDAITGEFRGDI
jgi:high affinity sulfate transporter 1